MSIREIMNQQKISAYRLSKESGVPYTTLSDILEGRTSLVKCSALTVYRLAETLGVTMESLLRPRLKARPDFELFKSNVCHRLRQMGDLRFVRNVLESREIFDLYESGWLRECLYMLAMLDYVSHENGLPESVEYNALRRLRLPSVVYPSGVRLMALVAPESHAMEDALNHAIPEFARFNIIECEVRNVV